jgi:hypothetical protein
VPHDSQSSGQPPWGSKFATALCSLPLRVFSPGGESRELWQVLALLYKGQGRPDLSLAIYLQLQLPSVFDFIQVRTLCTQASKMTAVWCR